MLNTMFKGSNNNLIKMHNMQVVLLSLLHDCEISRVQLAQKTNLSNSTISNLIAELIEQGIVSEGSPTDSDPGGLRPVGRPSTGIRIVPDARFVIGVHIGVGVFRVGVVNLLGELVNNQIEHFQVNEPALSVVEKILHSIETIIQHSVLERTRILGVGVGASGLVDFRAGVNILAPNLNWHNIPLRDLLQNRLRLPVVVDNNVRAMAIGEKFFGAGRDVESLAFVYGRIGVGAGLIFNGEALRGSTTGAGEIGHTVMLMEGGEPCRCGNHGCLETLVSEPAILREAQRLSTSNNGGSLAHLNATRPDLTPLDRVFLAAREGDPQIQQLLEKHAYYLGVAVAGLVNMFNPEMILFGGIYAQGQDVLLPPIIRTVNRLAFSGLGAGVHMQATGFGWRAGVIGAAALGLMNFIYQQSDSFHW